MCCDKLISIKSSKRCRVSSRKIVIRLARYQCHRHHVYSRKTIAKRIKLRISFRSHHFRPNHVSFNKSFKYLVSFGFSHRQWELSQSNTYDTCLFFAVYEDDLPLPSSAISVSGLSTATPPQVVGNRFFGPDFNIEQVKGNSVRKSNANQRLTRVVNFRFEYKWIRTITTHSADTVTVD